MESHIRIKFTANLAAIKELECSTLKVLMYLAGRSNHYGVCFPYQTTISNDSSLDEDTVYKAIGELITYGYIKCHRKTYHNRFTGESRPPLFQVSPHFLEIAEEFQPDAFAMWSENGNPKISDSNQQQELTAGKNIINQPQETTTTTNINRNFEEKPQTANRKPQTAISQTKQAAQPQSRLPNQNSAIVKNSTNPKTIKTFLPDDCQELLAERIMQLGIKLSLARGFVVEYGYEKCLVVADYVDMTIARQEIKSPAGFYRSLIQSDFMNGYIQQNYGADDDDLSSL